MYKEEIIYVINNSRHPLSTARNNTTSAAKQWPIYMELEQNNPESIQIKCMGKRFFLFL